MLPVQGNPIRQSNDEAPGLTAFNLTVTFINGSQNRPVMWARDRQKAIEIVTAYCAVKGWEVTSIE